MKNELNRAILGVANVGEVELFREMARQFNYNTLARATYVEEVHKQYVEFPSSFLGGIKKIELGDLLFITYDKSTKDLRVCVLQAKYRRKSYRKFLNCKADIYQWELLYYKPDINNRSKMNIPKHILNFRHDYKSIAAYGIFYHDKNLSMIDFLYTIPELFTPKSLVPLPSSTFSFNCPNWSVCKSTCCGCSTTLCPTKLGGVPKETLFTCSMDIFEHEVLHCKVGAPINDDVIKMSILKLLNEMKGDAEDSEIIDEILRDYENGYYGEIEDYKFYEGHPSAIIVITDSGKELVSYIR